MTPDIEELQKLLDDKSGGLWEVEQWDAGLSVSNPFGPLVDADDGAVPTFMRAADAVLIVAAINALPSLLAELRLYRGTVGETS